MRGVLLDLTSTNIIAAISKLAGETPIASYLDMLIRSLDNLARCRSSTGFNADMCEFSDTAV